MATQDKIKDTFDYYEVKSPFILPKLKIVHLIVG